MRVSQVHGTWTGRVAIEFAERDTDISIPPRLLS